MFHMKHADLTCLFQPAPPWLWQVQASHSDLTDLLWQFQASSAGLILRFLRGTQMTTEAGLYDEFAAALQFPYYFGFNGAAFDECLTDLAWLNGEGFVLSVFDGQEFLSKEPPSKLDLFLDALEAACECWSKPVQLGQAWDRPPRPFHVLFHCTMENQGRLPSRIGALASLHLDSTNGM
jgi:hypothetical protein